MMHKILISLSVLILLVSSATLIVVLRQKNTTQQINNEINFVSATPVPTITLQPTSVVPTVIDQFVTPRPTTAWQPRTKKCTTVYDCDQPMYPCAEDVPCASAQCINGECQIILSK